MMEEDKNNPSSILQRRAKPAFLEKKQSSGDLQSRLKTRKILGVGETDNGDVHRSKISQVLGHNEHLYMKLPKFYFIWHIFIAIICTTFGLLHLLLWSPYPKESQTDQEENESTVQLEGQYSQMYGATLVGFAVLMWSLCERTDKSLARALMTAVAVSQFLHVIVLCTSALHNKAWTERIKPHAFISLIIAAGSSYFYWAIGSSTAGLRKVASHKDLRDHHICDEQSCTECQGSTKNQSSTSSDSKKYE